MNIYISLVLSLFILAHAPLHAMLPPLGIQNNNTTPLKLLMLHKPLVDLGQIQKKRVQNRIEWHKPLTFQEQVALSLASQCEAARNAFLQQNNASKADFDKEFNRLSRLYKSRVFAGQVSIACNDSKVPNELLHLINRCAEEMHFFDRVSVASTTDTDAEYASIMVPEDILSHTIKGKEEPSLQLALDPSYMKKLTIAQQEAVIKHEISHAQKKHPLIVAALTNMSLEEFMDSERNDTYATMLQHFEYQAEVSGILTNKKYIPAVKTESLNRHCRLLTGQSSGLREGDDIIACQQIPFGPICCTIKKVDGAIVEHIIPNVGCSSPCHLEPLELVAYLIKLERAWDEHDRRNQGAAL